MIHIRLIDVFSPVLQRRRTSTRHHCVLRIIANIFYSLHTENLEVLIEEEEPDTMSNAEDGSAPLAVKFEVENHIARVTLDRPDKMNSINRAMRQQLWDAYHAIKADTDIWAVVLTGNGKAFCAGKDLIEQPSPEDETIPTNDDIYLLQRHLYKPIIVALNGACLAQGAGLALLSDIRIMSDGATLGWPQVRRGISSVSGPTLFAREIPLAQAAKYILRGIPMSSQEALDLRVVNEVVPHEKLLETAYRYANEILEAAPTAVQGMKEAAIRAQELGLEERIEMARGIADRVRLSQDAKEGILAFKEKRQPAWTGQ